MTSEISGKIYLADQRGQLATPHLRRYSTFSFGEYAHADRPPFGQLYGFNEETLAGGHTLELAVGQASHVLLLPITGALEVTPAAGPSTTIEAEEVQVLTLPAGTVLQLTNPYEADLVSFLHIWLLAEEVVAHVEQRVFPFDMRAATNHLPALVPFTASPVEAFCLSLGRFAGRGEAVYQLQRPGTRFFAYVLAGAFEAEGRLLHEGDGLALWQTTAIELEALSNNALLLILEF